MRESEYDLWITSKDIIVAYHSGDCESEDCVGIKRYIAYRMGGILILKVVDAAINTATFSACAQKKRVRLPRCLILALN